LYALLLQTIKEFTLFIDPIFKQNTSFLLIFERSILLNVTKFLTFRNKFEKIGTIKIGENNRKMGRQPPSVDTFEDFCIDWNWDGGKMKKKKRALIDLLE
jgi:hypothetical protein